MTRNSTSTAPPPPPSRVSSRSTKGQKRDRADSTPQLARRPAAKKQRAPKAPGATQVNPLFINDHDPSSDEATNDPPVPALVPVPVPAPDDPGTIIDEAEDNAHGGSEEDRPVEYEEEEEVEDKVLRFISTWRAVTDKKEELDCKTSRMEEGDISYYSITRWKGLVMNRLLPRAWRKVSTKATASYHGARVADHRSSVLYEAGDIYGLLEVMREWINQYPLKELSLNIEATFQQEVVIEAATPPAVQSQLRQTATRQQLNERVDIQAAEEAGGNFMCSIGDRWPCKLRACHNYSTTCFVLKEGGPELPARHLPVHGDELRLWNREIRSGDSTIDQPSNSVVAMLSAAKADRKVVKKLEVVPTSDPIQAQMKQLMDLTMVTALRSLTPTPTPSPYPYWQPPSYGVISSPSPATVPAPPPSSPLQNAGDGVDLLVEFLEWAPTRPGLGGDTAQVIKEVTLKMGEEQWDLEMFGDSSVITNKLWEEYGFKIRLLVRIRKQISHFKRYKRSQVSP